MLESGLHPQIYLTLLAAMGALLGATFAQIANHYIQHLRDRSAKERRRKELFEALKEELRFAVREAKVLLDGMPEEFSRGGGIIFSPQPWPAKFRPFILPQVALSDPVSPRLLAVLNSAYAELDLASDTLRALAKRTSIKPATYQHAWKSCDRAISLYALLLRARGPDEVPYEFQLTDDDKQKALTLAMFVDDEPLMEHPGIDGVGWVEIGEDGKIRY